MPRPLVIAAFLADAGRAKRDPISHPRGCWVLFDEMHVEPAPAQGNRRREAADPPADDEYGQILSRHLHSASASVALA